MEAHESPPKNGVRGPRWHRFAQDRGPDGSFVPDIEVTRWSDVLPGDIVQSNGTHAYRLEDFYGRDYDTRTLVLRHRPVLVLARIPGIIDDPGAPRDHNYVTFVCLSRHGLIVVVQWSR